MSYSHSDPEWRWRRMEAIVRDEYECQECGDLGGPEGDAHLHVHHEKPLSEGGTHDPENLVTLCKSCHFYGAHGWSKHNENSSETEDTDTDLNTPDGVPDNAYITIKETKPTYEYYYWQWRDGRSWKNEYIGPVSSTDLSEFQ